MDFYDVVVSEFGSNNRTFDYKVKPDFLYANTKDLICKGGAFYAFWDGATWRTDLDDVISTVDKSVIAKTEELKQKYPDRAIVAYRMNSNSSMVMKEFTSYTKMKQQSQVLFNSRILYSEDVQVREDYATTQLSFTPTVGETPAFDELMNVLYSEPELEKIMWFVGALYSNEMSKIEKFMFLYGGKGSGKGTVIKILKMLFEGYHAPISLEQLTSKSEFATSQIQEVPLLLDDDADLSRITSDTTLLKLTGHDPIIVNSKYKTLYEVTFTGLLVAASNQRFKVRNIDSGITRRAVVVEPTHETHGGVRYRELMALVKYEVPHIAKRAIDVFTGLGPHYYDNYVSREMLSATDHIYAFVEEVYPIIKDGISLKQVAELYKIHLEEIDYDTSGYKKKIKEEMKRYYHRFYDQKKVDGVNTYNYYEGFKDEYVSDVMLIDDTELDVDSEIEGLAEAVEEISIFDQVASGYQAQLATSKGTPQKKWDDVTTVLSDIDTTELHYVMVPMNHIVIDFDMKDEEGNKDLAKNLEESKKFPPTYMELSKSGGGVHLHYIYDGDVSTLAALYEDDIEVKVFTGKQSLRRKLTKFNNLPIAHITTGLPLKEKEGVKMYKEVEIITWNEKKIRTAVKGNLSKNYHASTKPSVDFIVHIFNQAEKEGIKYDLRDMRMDILAFAASSTNNSEYCVKAVNGINYCTIEQEADTMEIQKSGAAPSGMVKDEDIYFYDVEVFPNLFVVVFKKNGSDEVTKWINPSPSQIEEMLSLPLVGFNNRRYDNHILYARLIGEDNNSLYIQSQRIIDGKGSLGMYSGAYELSYCDIYEYSSKKQSLKKWEVELGITHDELELPWDKPVDESMWERVAEYCVNDVMATEAVFKATYHDYTARRIISTLSGLSVNATTTQQAAKFLFGNEKRPQDKFVYPDLSKEFPGYKFEWGKSEYRGEDPSEGGYVYAEPGVYQDVAVLDVASMHPNSLINMNYFGPYTPRFADLVQARIHIKHGNLDKAADMFGGALKPFLQDDSSADALGYAMKIIINIVYGMTSAKFDNKFKHKDNLDNVVAKRGALFMIELKHAVQEKGFTVNHIKTDSIKVPGATDELIDFIFKFGEKYGYTFEHEATYSVMALVNKAVFAAKYGWAEKEKLIGTWDTVGAQFAEPYVYKTLFSKEEIVEEDYMFTKQATAPIYLGERFVGKLARVYASISGDEMYRVTPDKKGHVSGTKGFGWKLAVDYTGKEDLDIRYYDGLVDTAKKAISRVGDIELILPNS